MFVILTTIFVPATCRSNKSILPRFMRLNGRKLAAGPQSIDVMHCSCGNIPG
jgi:hypothetical protein